MGDRNRGGSITVGMEAFSHWIAQEGILDIPLSNLRYTWSNLREVPSLAKLDRVLVTQPASLWVRTFKERYKSREVFPTPASKVATGGTNDVRPMFNGRGDGGAPPLSMPGNGSSLE
ncbi:hypothetical protein QJS10_CPB21g01504 [Acorus calamus]|uniref:Uncharacterized protein n=1 Tax=Acorus calamus TaxID=4465 RepID=A0AAV9C5J9_ACOCL|nr:hypothetical protein QJS10_CPB21g01504 [Acorus calamus]